ncbi:MAG: hypothetical protein IPK97_04875 [Ahniella sp.]|nr:hypothetical protein [Ahniella sp.]
MPVTTLNFADGDTSETIPVTINGDMTVEPDETFTMTLSNPVGGTIADGSGQGTITNDDAAANTFSINDQTLVEGNAGTSVMTFTVTRTSGTGVASVQVVSSNGTATAGSDYVAVSVTTLNFADGDTSETIPVTINGDMTVEADETFAMTLSNPTGGTIADGSGQGTITNDDAAANTFSINDQTIAEGNAGTSVMTFTVTRTSGTGVASVQVVSSNGTATAGSDYVAVPTTTLNFADGDTSETIPVTINGDMTVEADETFTMTLSNPVGGTIADGSGQARSRMTIRRCRHSRSRTSRWPRATPGSPLSCSR